jgi:hypothetical protein
MEALLPVGDVELCVDTVGWPTGIPPLLIGTTVATWDDDLPRVLSGSPQSAAAEARAHSAGILDRSGPHPAAARNGLRSTVFSTLD